MAKDDNMPSKKEITQFLAHMEQLTGDDEVFKEKLSYFLRNIVGRTSTQHNTLPIQNDIKVISTPLLDSKLTHAMQQDNDRLQQQSIQLVHSNQKLEEEKMCILDLFKRKEQDFSHLESQRNKLSQDNQELKKNNDRLNSEVNDLNRQLNSFKWTDSIKPEFDFLRQVKNHPELASILLPNGDENLLQLIAISSQWNNVLRVWDALAIQVKKTQQTISTTEQQILEHSLALFNLTLQSNQAILQSPELGASYDYDIHQKVSGSGGSIEQILLAGLYNAAGDNVRTAIVATR